MVRKFVFACVVMAFSVGILSAAEMFGVITKVDGDKVTFKEAKKNDEGKVDFKNLTYGPEKAYTVAKDFKTLKGGFGKKDGKGAEATPLEGGLKHKMFTEISEKGQMARITTNDDNKITEIRVFAFGGKKKKKDSGQ